MPATDLTTDIDIVNAALAGLGLNPITAFTDNTEQAKVANATYLQHLEAVMSAHPWNFAMKHGRLDMAIKPTPAWRWDYAYDLSTLTTPLRIWEIEDQGADDEEEWTVSDDLLLSNLKQETQWGFGTDDAQSSTNRLLWAEHTFTNDEAVILVDGGNGLPSGLLEDQIYYVVNQIADTSFQLSLTKGGAAVAFSTNGGNGNTLIYRTVDCRYIERIDDETKYSSQFIQALIAKLQSEWAEPLVKATTLGERMDQKFEDKLSLARSIDGQEGTPERQDTSTWIDSR